MSTLPSVDDVIEQAKALEEAWRDAFKQDGKSIVREMDKFRAMVTALHDAAVEGQKDKERLDWLIPKVTGKNYREIGIDYGDISQIRDLIDAAMKQEQGT